MTNFTFTNKAEYLQFRAQWKADYEAMSLDQREAKKDVPAAMRRYNISGAYAYHRILCQSQDAVMKNKSALNKKLEDLKAAKVRAAEQYLANKSSENPYK